MRISAVILSGGKSSRMGRDKALLPFGGYSTMAEYQYRRLKQLFERVYLSSKSDKFLFEADIIYDRYESVSPLNAIISALEELKTDAIFVLAVDMPLVSDESIKKLIKEYKKNSAYDLYCFSIDGNLEPTVAIYSKTILNLAKENFKKNIHKLKSLVQMSNYKAIECKNGNEFVNLNRMEEYLKYK